MEQIWRPCNWKARKNLRNLQNYVKLLSEKFDEFEKHSKENEPIIKNLLGDVDFLKERISLLQKKRDNSKQYFHRNPLLVHGVQEHVKESFLMYLEPYFTFTIYFTMKIYIITTTIGST